MLSLLVLGIVFAAVLVLALSIDAAPAPKSSAMCSCVPHSAGDFMFAGGGAEVLAPMLERIQHHRAEP